MKKRLLTILLIFCMVLTMIPVGGVFAAGEDPATADEDPLTYEYKDSDNKKTATVIAKGANDPYSGKITIPSSVTHEGTIYTVTGIGEGAFSNCKDLTSIEIPNSVTSIGKSAFNGCIGLTSIKIPDSVKTIENSAFLGCIGLKSITIPNSVETIEEAAFSGCKKLESITFAAVSKLESIGKEAFSGCIGLKSITIPNSVETIGENAFSRCAIKDVATDSFTGLTSITFAAGSRITSIGNKAFYKCSALESIEIPNNVTSIGNSAFDSCSKLESITFAAGSQLKSIEGSVFAGCTGLTSIKIPNGVTGIGARAFDGCTGLTRITIPDSVTSIAGDAFSGCSKLDNINIGQNSKFCFDNEGKVLFDKNKTMLVAYLHSGVNSSYIIPESVTSIGNSAFSGCKGLTSITIPKSVKTIGVFAFLGCKGLTSITIPNSVTSIGVGAFSSCTELTGITFASGSKLESIGDEAFSMCSALKSIEIPNSVTSIGDSAFSGCSSLTSITFASGSQLTSIENEAFNECNKLTIVIYGDNAHNNTTLTSKFPDGTMFIFFETKPEFEVNHITSASVTLNEITGATNNSGKDLTVQYRVKKVNINTDDGWQTEPIFEGLEPDTEYTFEVGFFDDDDTTPKAVYELAPVTTNKKTPSYTPPANPTIDITGKEGGTVIYDRIRHTVTITPNDNYLVKEIIINGTTVPVTDGAMVLENIYGWSRISVTFEPKPEPAFEPDKYISELKFKASSSKTSKGNIRIKVTSVTDDNGNKIDLTELKDKGYTVKFKYYRSTKKASKYTAKVEKDADINSYINTVGKKGTRYYYKVRVMVYDADGNLVAKSDLKQCSYAARTWSK